MASVRETKKSRDASKAKKAGSDAAKAVVAKPDPEPPAPVEPKLKSAPGVDDGTDRAVPSVDVVRASAKPAAPVDPSAAGGRRLKPVKPRKIVTPADVVTKPKPKGLVVGANATDPNRPAAPKGKLDVSAQTFCGIETSSKRMHPAHAQPFMVWCEQRGYKGLRTQEAWRNLRETFQREPLSK